MRQLSRALFDQIKARRSFAAVLVAMMLLIMSGVAAQAGSYLFNFNSSSLYNPSTPITAGPPTSDNVSAIRTYMDGLLPAGTSVTVSGATSSGSNTNYGYAGEGYVLCTGGGHGSGCTPDTLAVQYKTGSNDTPFLVTDGSAQYKGNNAITMAFSGNIQVTSVSFDFEIFPDASCPGGTGGCSQVPSFSFVMTNSTGSTTYETCTVDAVAPGTALTTTAPSSCPGTSGVSTITSFSGGPSGSTNTGSYNDKTETAYQYIGSMTVSFTNPVTNPTLNFVDWPATIGVTNIQLTTIPVPEPSTLSILVSGLIGIGIFCRRRRFSA